MTWMHETLLPWHQTIWPELVGQSGKNGGLLISGPSGHGKRHLGRYLSQALLCESPKAGMHPCGQCASCMLCRVNQHPDWVEIVTEQHIDEFNRLRTEAGESDSGADAGDSGEGGAGSEKTAKSVSRVISIKDIRKLETLTQLTAHRGGRRVVLIWPADDMSVEASNALLKVLEEPGEGLHFILVAAHAARLLPTVRSRLRIQACPPADRQTALTWLGQQEHLCTRPPGQDGHLSGVGAEIALGLACGAPLQACALAGGATDDRSAALRGDTLEVRDAFVRWLLNPSESLRGQRPGDFDKMGLGTALQLMIQAGSEILRLQAGATISHLQHLQDALLRFKSVDVRALHELLKTCLDFMPNADHPVNVRMQLDELTLRWFNALRPLPN